MNAVNKVRERDKIFNGYPLSKRKSSWLSYHRPRKPQIAVHLYKAAEDWEARGGGFSSSPPTSILLLVFPESADLTTRLPDSLVLRHSYLQLPGYDKQMQIFHLQLSYNSDTSLRCCRLIGGSPSNILSCGCSVHVVTRCRCSVPYYWQCSVRVVWALLVPEIFQPWFYTV